MALKKKISEDRDYMLGELKGQVHMILSSLKIIDNRNEAMELSLETMNQKFNTFLRLSETYKDTYKDKFSEINDKLRRDYDHLHRLDDEVKRTPEKRRKFLITLASHAASILASIVATLTVLHKTGWLK
jgi:hypothetical protein